MPWSKKISQLIDVLGELVPNQDGITKYIRDAELKPQMIRFQGNALDIWADVLSEADKNSKVDKLIKAVLNHYPDNPYLLSALSEKEINYTLSPDLDKTSTWAVIETDTLEKLTKDVSTLLPISFLEKGIKASRSVAKVEINMPGSKQVGTGFLFKTEDQSDIYFMTNYHVINDVSQFANTRVIFNFEEDVNGNSKASKSFRIDLDINKWYKSPVEELDVSIFKLNCSDAELEEFGILILKKVIIQQNDFVNIIQHPAGQMKQISLYHNMVTNTSDRVVQYLTDTQPGSSGSPVFNSDWNVVAIHHSGGRQKVNEPNLPSGFKSRNEGIHINKIIDFFNRSLAIV